MNGIDGQLAAVGLIVAAAAGYVLRTTWRTWFAAKAGGCGSGCGTCAGPAPEDAKPGRIALPRA